MARIYKLYTDKTAFESDREHLDRLYTKLEGHKFPETPDQHVRGSRAPAFVPGDKRLAKHWDDGQKRVDRNEYALAIDADKVGKFHGDKETISGAQHTFDLTTTHNSIPEEWETEPAPKVFEAIP